jgi:isopenicillin N synthase-like dioxygenase
LHKNPGTSIHSDIPIVDFAAFGRGDAKSRAAVAALICSIARSLGFVYLRGIAITQGDVDRMFARMAAFFALPDAAKRPLARARPAGATLRCGYVPRGREHEDSSTPSDIKEAFDLYRSDSYYRAAFAPAREDEAPFAAEVQGLVDDFAAFHDRCALAANDVLRAFAIEFGLPEPYFVDRHGQNNILRLLHYPPIPETVLTGQMRVGSHTDFGSLTLLFQDPSAGLEVLSAGGRWLKAPSIPGTVLINIGDLMQQWTNCGFRSTPHRVDVPSGEGALRPRYSIAFFCEPNNETEVACLPALQSGGEPLFVPVIAGEHLAARLDRTLIAK